MMNTKDIPLSTTYMIVRADGQVHDEQQGTNSSVNQLVHVLLCTLQKVFANYQYYVVRLQRIVRQWLAWARSALCLSTTEPLAPHSEPWLELQNTECSPCQTCDTKEKYTCVKIFDSVAQQTRL